MKCREIEGNKRINGPTRIRRGGVGNSLYDTKQGKKDDRESGANIREVTE